MKFNERCINKGNLLVRNQVKLTNLTYSIIILFSMHRFPCFCFVFQKESPAPALQEPNNINFCFS